MVHSPYTIEHLRPDTGSSDQDLTPGVPNFETITLGELVRLKLPERQQIIAPIIPVQGLAMLYAARGIGKTHVALGLSYAVSCGGAFLRWQAHKPRRVLYLDGEMPAQALQERARQIIAASPHQPPTEDYFRLLSMDRQSLGLSLNLAKPEHQAALEPHLIGVELVVIDNISTLVSGGRENDADSWDAMQAWLLQLRRQGISVLLIHHAGRGENARGTSKREDVLDTVIQLKRPEDYDPEEGARFEVHLTKARGVFGDDALPFEAKLEVIDGQAHWTCKTLQDHELVQVEELSQAGMSVRDIAAQTGLSRSRVNRMQMKLREEGRLRH
ncbi:AAA family ATPase [Microvirga terrae]|uniref:AAA family ATPase n=1 Tax=Microvirga terrae TaxID=2740529 RepID=A0ABY5RNN0_9HYPH|nr:AAA family ATPase [Microvirga terrae]UVF18840.1 AAA family ATPase [Microvirga terrae]